MKNRSTILVAALPVLACLALLPEARAVSPAPDGCYPGFTTAEGCNALNFLTTGQGNTGVGWYSLYLDTISSYNTGVGAGALALNNATAIGNAGSNTAVGTVALLLNTSGFRNTAVGTDALLFNDRGNDNNAIGAFALFENISGNINNAHGRDALTNSDGGSNNAMGDDALLNNTTGGGNTAFGHDALDQCIDGAANVAIGDEAGTLVVHATGVIAIGGDVNGGGPFTDRTRTCYIGGIFDEPVSDSGSAQAVYVDQFNVLGFLPSSRLFKHDIKPMDKASEELYALKPVTFKYNSDKKGMTQYGLIAEEVAEVNPDLVLHGKTGIDTVRYEQINAMLLNEFLKEHKKVEDLQATVAQQDKEMEVLTAQRNEQAAQIQRVSAQLEVNAPAPRVVVNKP